MFFIIISFFARALTLLRIWRFPPPVFFPTQLRHRTSAINVQVQSQSAAEKEKSRQDKNPAGFQRVKKVCDFFDTLQIRHIFCEAYASRKISLRSSKSPYRTFLMAIIQLEAGLFSLRLGHGAALTCHRHVIHSRAAASLPLKLPRCAVIFPRQQGFLTD